MLKKLLFASAMVIFATALQAQTIIWEENFEGGTTLPAGWIQQTAATDGGWKVGTAAALSSSSFPIPNNASGNILATNDDGCNCNKMNDIVILPMFDLSAYADTSLYLTYDIFFGKLCYQGITEGLDAYASEDNGATWTTLKPLKGRPSWIKPSGFDVSDYAGKDSILLALRYSDGGGWLYGAAVDNFKLVIPDNTLKASLNGVALSRYIDAIPTYFQYSTFWAGGEMFITGSVNNPGFQTITSFDLLINDGGFNTDTVNFTGLNIPFDEGHELAIPYTVKQGANDLSITLVNINGGSDNDPADNDGEASVTGVTPVTGRKVVLEEATGTWCQWCPRGAVMLDYMAESYPETVIPIAVHNGDPMKVTAYDTPFSQLIGGSYPKVAVDRVHIGDPLEFEDFYIDRMTDEPTIVINQNVDYDESTRKITVTSYVKFLEEMNGDFGIAVVYTENDVTGTTSTYGQVNAYSGGCNGEMGGYENLPATVPAASMVYNHVARNIVGTFTGNASAVPDENPAESIISFESSYTHPVSFDVTEMHAITLFIDKASGDIVNAEQTAIPNLFVGTNDPNEIVSVSMFPNPVQDAATIKMNLKESSDVQMRIMDAYGKVSIERNYSNISGEQRLPFQVGNLASGAYLLSVTAKGQTVTKPFVIVR